MNAGSKAIRVSLPAALYRELCEAAAAMDEPYTPAAFATEVVIADLASRRIARMPVRHSHGARVKTEPVTHRVLLPCEK